MYFSANEVPFGAKGSKARKEFMRKEYNKPRTLKSAGAALNNGEDAMYLQREVERVAARGQDEQDPALPLTRTLTLTRTLPLTRTLTPTPTLALTLAVTLSRIPPSRGRRRAASPGRAPRRAACAEPRPPPRSGRATSGPTTCRASRRSSRRTGT